MAPLAGRLRVMHADPGVSDHKVRTGYGRNGVTLEDEMMKVTTNQMDYQTVTTLYSRSMRLLRTALGRQG